MAERTIELRDVDVQSTTRLGAMCRIRGRAVWIDRGQIVGGRLPETGTTATLTLFRSAIYELGLDD